MGLGIKYVGIETAELLAEHFGDLHHVQKASYEELLGIEGIGEKTAKAIAEYFEDPDHLEEIKRLLNHGVCPRHERRPKHTGHPFSSKTFVLTGALEHYSRDEVSSLIKERGGKVSGSVSKKTDYVLVGSDPGSKYSQAQELGIAILSEAQFVKLL
jgi:DNA ligase (NAD+)